MNKCNMVMLTIIINSILSFTCMFHFVNCVGLVAYLQICTLKCQEAEHNIMVVIIHFHVSFLVKDNVKSKDDVFKVLVPTMQIQRKEFLEVL